MVGSIFPRNFYCAASTINESGKYLHRGNNFDNSEAVQVDLSNGMYLEDEAERKRIATGIYTKSEFAINYMFFNDYIHGTGYDLDAEFETFMKERGCENERELEIISKSGCYTMNEFKEKAANCIQNDIKLMENLGFAKSDMSQLKDYVKENVSVEDLYSYINHNSYKDRVNIFIKIIDSFQESTSMKFNKQDALDMADKMIEYLKENNIPDKPPLSAGQIQYNLYLMSQYTKLLYK